MTKHIATLTDAHGKDVDIIQDLSKKEMIALKKSLSRKRKPRKRKGYII